MYKSNLRVILIKYLTTDPPMLITKTVQPNTQDAVKIFKDLQNKI